jgi:hypothetical protein
MFVPGTSSRPPQDLAIPYNEQMIFTIMTQIPFLFVLYKAIKNLNKGDPTCLLFAIGGIIASGFEPVVDVMGFCFFPREGSWIAFEFHGRPIPVFVPATYGWFVGGQGYWFLTVLRNKTTTRSDVWKLWLRSFAANLLLEYPALYWGIYVYYGHQPFSVGGFPLWFPAIHAISPMMAAAFVFALQDNLKGLKKGFVIPAIVSSSYVMANAGIGWPVWVALSVDNGYGATYTAGIFTASLLITTIWVISLTIPEDIGKTVKKANGSVRHR